MDKIDAELQNNFQSSLNPHDAHVQAWTGQLDAMHPLQLVECVRQAERDSFGNAWDYWQEIDKDTPASQNDLVPVPNATLSHVVAKNQRQDLLTPLIEAAQRGETNLFSSAVIWPKLCSKAECNTRPLIDVSADGIKWLNGNDEVQFLTKKALSDRLRRMKVLDIAR